MTESRRPHSGTNAVACQVTIYQRESYVAVKFILKNVCEKPVTVAYRQTVPDELTGDHLSFTANYMSEAWHFEDATLEFTTEIGGTEQIETVYGIKGVDIPALVDFINYSTIVVTQDETTIETVTDIEPDIEGATDTTRDEEASADDTATSDQQSAETEAVSDDESSAGDGETDTDDVDQGPKDESVASGDDTIQWVTPTTTTASSAVKSSGETTEAAAPADDAATAESHGAASHVPFSDGRAAGPERAPALPANREDYILEDVRGEIGSPAEFDWVDLVERPADDAEPKEGVIGWVRSRLPF